jgi:cysteine synthase
MNRAGVRVPFTRYAPGAEPPLGRRPLALPGRLFGHHEKTSPMTTIPRDSHIARRLEGISCLIGNTPLLAIRLSLRGSERTIYAKAEHLNLTGSIKDRMALHILRRAYESGALKPGAPIIEATSGNTGLSFAAIGRSLGHAVIIFMPEWMSLERRSLMASFGAEIVLVTAEQGGFRGSIRMAEERAARLDDAFLPHQFSNEDNSEAHALATGPEIWWQLQSVFARPDAFVAGVGTGGTIMGVGHFLRAKRPGCRLHPVEPASSAVLCGGPGGKHRIQGICDEFVPPIVDLEYLDEPILVADGDAIIMAQKLARELGLGIGISSGANVLGAVLAQERLGLDAVVATVLPDDNKKYLSTDLLREEPVEDAYVSPDVSFLSYRSIRRPCSTCCDPEFCASEPPPGFVADQEPMPGCTRRR